jgi:hypothetical protein
LEIYLKVSKSFAIDRFTFKAFLEENNLETEVFRYDPEQDDSAQGEYKQLPKTFPIAMKFDSTSSRTQLSSI